MSTFDPTVIPAFASAWRVHRETRSGILIDSCDYYRAFYTTAKQARRSILLLGWQFDSDVQLVRGDDVPTGVDPESLRLLRFLEDLCAERTELEVRVLAWDHSVLFSMERELLQKLWFNLHTGSRFHFEVDNTVPEYGAHHQKVAIIDGQVAFLGSGDICQDRWDTSAHTCDQPLRLGRGGKTCKPYHEVQATVSGDIARSLLDMFVERWEDAKGETLDPEALIGSRDTPLAIPVPTFAMPTTAVGIYRELPYRLGRPPIREVKDLLVGAILAAEMLIYIETQYLTSEAIAEAMTSRMRAAGRPKLDIVIMLPHKPEALKEELAIGGTQAKLLADLVAIAAETGHAVGVYNVAVPSEGDDLFVYIHAKLMIVDDRMLTVGSANLNNRSMSLDSEVHAAWIAREQGDEVGRAVEGLRHRLLREHIGHPVEASVLAGSGVVGRLDTIVRAGEGRLRAHDVAPAEASGLMLAAQKLASAHTDPVHAPESASLTRSD